MADPFDAIIPQAPTGDAFDAVLTKAPKSGPQKAIEDVNRSVLQGVTGGFGDEAIAGVKALAGNGTYTDQLKQEQARTEEIPGIIRYPGEALGAAGMTMATAPVAAPIAAVTGLAKLPAVVRGLLGGGALGALFGAGNAEPGLENRAQGAAVGAGVGGAIGAATVPAAKLATDVVGAGKAMMMPETGAALRLAQSARRDATTPDYMLARLAQEQQARPEATLLDVAGPDTKLQVERMAQTPGAARTIVETALTARQKQQAARLSMDLGALTGTRESALQATERVVAERSKEGAPLWQTAMTEGDRPIWNAELERLSGAKEVQAAMHKAIGSWQTNAIADGYGAMNPGAEVTAGGMLKMLHGKVPVLPNLQFWQYTKQTLDDMVRASLKNGETNQARALTKITGKLREALDTEVPSYKAARDAWAGKSQFLDAIEEGRMIRNQDLGADEVKARLADMSTSERDGYVVGAVSAIIRRMRNEHADLADFTKLLKSPEMRDKVAALMPNPEMAAKWTDRLNFEVGTTDTMRKTLGNSRTAVRQASQDEADNLAIDLIKDVALHRTGLVDIIKHGLEVGKNKVRSRADKILAEALTGPNPEQQLPRLFDKAQQATSVPPSVVRRGAPSASAATEIETDTLGR